MDHSLSKPFGELITAILLLFNILRKHLLSSNVPGTRVLRVRVQYFKRVLHKLQLLICNRKRGTFPWLQPPVSYQKEVIGTRNNNETHLSWLYSMTYSTLRHCPVCSTDLRSGLSPLPKLRVQVVAEAARKGYLYYSSWKEIHVLFLNKCFVFKYMSLREAKKSVRSNTL